MIDILVPVLGRPGNVDSLIESIYRTTSVPHKVWFLTSPDDEAQREACLATDERIIEVEGKHNQYPRKMNVGFRASTESFVLLAADDIDFQADWDTIALTMAEETGAGVIGLNDLANKQVMKGVWSTHPLVRRSYIMEQGGSLDGPGTLLHEGFDHNFVERELCGLAMQRGKWDFAPEAKVKHRHPIYRTATEDETYKKGQSTFRQDQLLFLERAKLWGEHGLLPGERAAIRQQEQQARRRRRRVSRS